MKRAKTSKKAAKKTVKKSTTRPALKPYVVANVVTPQGEVRLSNGLTTSCSVGKNGPTVKKGDEFKKVGGAWVPRD